MNDSIPLPRLTPDDAANIGRLGRFRATHPCVNIRQADFGAGWDAQIPLPPDGLGYYAPRPLGLLLDALEEELDYPP